MESVANVMEVQKLVKDFAAGKSEIKDPLDLNKKIIEIYQKDQKYLNGNISNNVEWIRETADKKPFKGKLSDLILEESKKITSPELEDNISRLHSYIVSAEKGKPVQGSFTARFSSASSQQQDLVR